MSPGYTQGPVSLGQAGIAKPCGSKHKAGVRDLVAVAPGWPGEELGVAAVGPLASGRLVEVGPPKEPIVLGDQAGGCRTALTLRWGPRAGAREEGPPPRRSFQHPVLGQEHLGDHKPHAWCRGLCPACRLGTRLGWGTGHAVSQGLCSLTIWPVSPLGSELCMTPGPCPGSMRHWISSPET